MNKKETLLTGLGLGALVYISLDLPKDHPPVTVLNPEVAQEIASIQQCISRFNVQRRMTDGTPYEGLEFRNSRGLVALAQATEQGLPYWKIAPYFNTEQNGESGEYSDVFRDGYLDNYFVNGISSADTVEAIPLSRQKEYEAYLKELAQLCAVAQSGKRAPRAEYKCADEKGHVAAAEAFLPSVVQIDFIDPSDNHLSGTCSGFFVEVEGKTLIATARHCLMEQTPACEKDIRMCSPSKSYPLAFWPKDWNGKDEIKELYLSYAAPLRYGALNSKEGSENDVALLAVSENIKDLNVRPLPISEKKPQNSTYILMGHPHSSSWYSLPSTYQTEEEGVYTLHYPEHCFGIGGLSGGPAVDENSGEVIGLVSRSQLSSQNISVTPIHALKELTGPLFDANYAEAQATIFTSEAKILVTSPNFSVTTLTEQGAFGTTWPKWEPTK